MHMHNGLCSEISAVVSPAKNASRKQFFSQALCTLVQLLTQKRPNSAYHPR